jgi:hypothetical protein
LPLAVACRVVVRHCNPRPLLQAYPFLHEGT